jgi:hypothetical protein
MLDLYQYTASNGGRGHVSGTSEQDAQERLTKRGITARNIEPLGEDEPETPGWPPSAQLQIYLDQVMQAPDFF